MQYGLPRCQFCDSVGAPNTATTTALLTLAWGSTYQRHASMCFCSDCQQIRGRFTRSASRTGARVHADGLSNYPLGHFAFARLARRVRAISMQGANALQPTAVSTLLWGHSLVRSSYTVISSRGGTERTHSLPPVAIYQAGQVLMVSKACAPVAST